MKSNKCEVFGLNVEDSTAPVVAKVVESKVVDIIREHTTFVTVHCC